MKKILFSVLAAITASISLFSITSCNDGETYADQKEKEKKSIKAFLADNPFGGPINVISEAQFYAQDSTTDVSKNEYVLFNDDGIYMQIINKGGGRSLADMAKDMPDSTTTKTILCRFLEYDIQNADTTYQNKITYESIVDKMICTYSTYSKSYTASFTDGIMMSFYGSTVVPDSWIKPLDFILLSKNIGNVAKVRLIAPHSAGHEQAGQYVKPFYYEIDYQLGK